jgi:hypothetical protein
VEARVEFPLQKATVTGRIDILLHDGNCIEIRDYNTSKDSTYAFITTLSIIIKILNNVNYII